MRALVTLFLFLLVLPVINAFAQGSDDNVSVAVRRVLDEQQSAWNRRDLDGFMAGYWHSPDLTFISGGTKTSGWQATIDRYRKKYQSEGHQMGKLEFSDLNIQTLSSDSAFVRGSWRLTMPDGKTPHGLFTLIFRNFPDGWKIVHDHTSE